MADLKRILRTDKDWSAVEDEVCRVTDFVPMSMVVDGQVKALKAGTPYASVTLQSPMLPKLATGFISHKLDFAMLWAAFNERTHIPGVRAEVEYDPHPGGPDQCENSKLARHGVAPNEEVWLVWTKKRYRTGFGLLSGILPKLIVMV
jgi:hypothetical protein